MPASHLAREQFIYMNYRRQIRWLLDESRKKSQDVTAING